MSSAEHSSEPAVPSLESLRIQIFADTANLSECISLNHNPLIKGFTTNPSLMRAAGVADYERFCRDLLEHVQEKPVSFEVFADDFEEMERQARIISAWAPNAIVKIPVTNTHGTSATPLVQKLIENGVSVNVTAIFTEKQIDEVARALHGAKRAYISVFAGRIADTGRDPSPYVRHAVEALSTTPGALVIWASTREIYNIYQANLAECDVITIIPSIIRKLSLIGHSLDNYSQETVSDFFKAANLSGYYL